MAGVVCEPATVAAAGKGRLRGWVRARCFVATRPDPCSVGRRMKTSREIGGKTINLGAPDYRIMLIQDAHKSNRYCRLRLGCTNLSQGQGEEPHIRVEGETSIHRLAHNLAAG